MIWFRMGIGSILALAVIAAACGGGPGPGAASSCLLSSADSAFLNAGPVFSVCGVDEKARLIQSSVREDFRPSGVPRSLPATMCYSAEVRLVVDAQGRVEPETVRLVRATHPDYGQAVLAGARAWRFEPALREGIPVRQIVQEKRMAALRVVAVGQGRPSGPPRC